MIITSAASSTFPTAAPTTETSPTICEVDDAAGEQDPKKGKKMPTTFHGKGKRLDEAQIHLPARKKARAS